MLLLLIPEVAPIGLTLDTRIALADTLYRLGFQNPSDLNIAPWLTAAELQEWSDRAADHLAVATAVFLTFDESIAVAAGTALYTLPTGHGFTVLAALVGANKVLRITPAVELWALDSNWQAAAADPVAGPLRLALDAGALGTATVYPVPVAADTLAQVMQQDPVSKATLPLPQVLQGYFSDAMVLGARRKESDHRQAEVADHLEQRLLLYDKVIQHLYGAGQ